MNWFSKEQQIGLLKKLASSINKESMVKYAQESSSASFDWKNQMGEYVTFGDVNRYVMDSYAIKLFITKTNDNITISLMTNHGYLGTAQYCVFWAYGLDEEKAAKKIYYKINETIKEVVKDFISNQKPTSLFDPHLRQRIQMIDDRNLVRTNIPTINYSYDIDYSGDWDKNIYGNRYPSYKEESFTQYTNNSYYTDDQRVKGKFAL